MYHILNVKLSALKLGVRKIFLATLN